MANSTPPPGPSQALHEPSKPAPREALTPAPIDARLNWIYLGLGLLCVAMLMLLAAGLAKPTVTGSQESRPSTFFTAPSGARGLLLVLQKLLPEAEVWRRPLEHLAEPGEDGPSNLIIADPTEPLSPVEAQRLQDWVASGGQLILAIDRDWEVRSEDTPTPASASTPTPASASTATPAPATPAPATPAPATPSPARAITGEPTPGLTPPPTLAPIPTLAPMVTDGFLSRLGLTLSRVQTPTDTVSHWDATNPANPAGRQRLSLTSAPVLQFEGTFETLLSYQALPVAVSVSQGEGRVVVIGDKGFFTNRGLRRGDNAVWLVQLIHGWGNRRVLFDEFHHGFGAAQPIGQLLWAFALTPYGLMLGQLGLAGLLYVVGVRRRQGRVIEPVQNSVRSPLALVQARGRLYQEAQTRQLAVELLCQQLCQELARPLGLLNLQRLDEGQGAGTEARELNFGTLYPALQARNLSESTQKQLDRLHTIYQHAQKGERLSDAEVLEAGQLTARIPREVLSGV